LNRSQVKQALLGPNSQPHRPSTLSALLEELARVFTDRG
jgi:hypothetical protein